MVALRIAFIVDQFPALTETFILNQITGLLDQGHQVDILSRSSAPRGPMPAGIRGHDLDRCTTRVNIPRTGFWRFLKTLLLLPILLVKHPVRVFRIAALHARDRTTPVMDTLHFVVPLSRLRSPHDIIHGQFGPLGSIAAVLRDVGLLDGKLVTSFRGYDTSLYIRRFGRDVYRRLLVRGDLFLAACDHIRNRLVTELGADENRVVVHRSGIDFQKFDRPPHPDRTRRPTRILTVGRLVEKKGVEFAVRALARVVRDHSDLVYTIIGDGTLNSDLRALVRELRLEERVSMLGERDHTEIVEHLSRSSLVVAPSVTAGDGDEEGIPNAIKEAMAAGLPVVSTRHAGIPELVKDGVNGYLVPERDVEALAARIRDLLAHPEQRDAMGRAGRRFIQQNYDTEELNTQLVSLYNRLL